jgi:hypothetical protein
MTWIPLLLADPSPSLRLLVLRELLNRPAEDAEVRELSEMQDTDPLISDLLELQQEDGSWASGDLVGNAPGGKIQATAQVLTRFGYFSLGADHAAVVRAADYIFSQQDWDGSWPIAETYGDGDDDVSDAAMIPLQTALPLRGLAACGYATDPRAERGYEWLLAQRLEDGAWPTGTKEGNLRLVGGYRRLAHSRFGCRTNTTAALICLAHHPQRRVDLEAQRALDMLLARETRDQRNIGFEIARMIGLEPASGYLTFFARFDLALVLDLCWRVGASKEDERIADLAAYIQGLQGDYGLWVYERLPQASRWVTFDLLRSLSRLDEEGDWVNMEPRTPFRAYTRQKKRF